MRDVATVTVKLLAPVVAPTGGHWNAGEMAAFEPSVAARLVARGVAAAVPTKAPSGPPADKMLAGAPAKKTKRW